MRSTRNILCGDLFVKAGRCALIEELHLLKVFAREADWV